HRRQLATPARLPAGERSSGAHPPLRRKPALHLHEGRAGADPIRRRELGDHGSSRGGRHHPHEASLRPQAVSGAGRMAWRSRVRAAVGAMGGVVFLLWLALPASGQPTADQVLSSAGFSADDKQRVLDGEFVTASAKAVSDRDLVVSMAFLVKTSPETLSRLVVTGSLITADAQV